MMVRWIFLAAFALALFNEVTTGQSFAGDGLRYILGMPVSP